MELSKNVTGPRTVVFGTETSEEIRQPGKNGVAAQAHGSSGKNASPGSGRAGAPGARSTLGATIASQGTEGSTGQQ